MTPSQARTFTTKNINNAKLIKQNKALIDHSNQLIVDYYPYTYTFSINDKQYCIYTNQPDLVIKTGQTLTTNKQTIIVNNHHVLDNVDIVGPTAITVDKQHITKQLLNTTQCVVFFLMIDW